MTSYLEQVDWLIGQAQEASTSIVDPFDQVALASAVADLERAVHDDLELIKAAPPFNIPAYVWTAPVANWQWVIGVYGSDEWPDLATQARWTAVNGPAYMARLEDRLAALGEVLASVARPDLAEVANSAADQAATAQETAQTTMDLSEGPGVPAWAWALAIGAGALVAIRISGAGRR